MADGEIPQDVLDIARSLRAARPTTAADEALKKSGDINNVQVPRTFLEYPKHLYSTIRPASGETPKLGRHFIEVKDKATEAAAIAKGWSLTPPPPLDAPKPVIPDAPSDDIPAAPVAPVSVAEIPVAPADAPAAPKGRKPRAKKVVPAPVV